LIIFNDGSALVEFIHRGTTKQRPLPLYKEHPMYVLNVNYTQAPAQVEAHIPPHGAWVKQHIANGNFLFAGPKKSGLGGAILAKAMPKADLLALLAQDPYVAFDVADYQIIDFDCKLAAPALESLLQA
jgi:uncharacterized protein YciI